MILDPRYTGFEMGITFLKQDECNKFIEGYFVKSKELPQIMQNPTYPHLI